MELSCLLTRAVAVVWPEGEAWKVMKKFQDIYGPKDMQLIAEGRFMLGSIKMGADENPSILFCKLANLETAYAHTKHLLTDHDMIGAIFAIATEKYRATIEFGCRESGQCLAAEPLGSCYEKDLAPSGSSKGLSTVKMGTEIVLNAFIGICYVAKLWF